MQTPARSAKIEVIANDMIMLDGRQDDTEPGQEEPPLWPQQRNVPTVSKPPQRSSTIGPGSKGGYGTATRRTSRELDRLDDVDDLSF